MNASDAGRFHGMEIAIVGMAGRFPKAADLDTFWRNVRDGVHCISSFSDRQMEEAGVPAALRRDPAYVNAGGVLEDADLFDAAFFQMNAREAEITDPQQRLFLECCWQALEDAGYDPETFDGDIGVYAGVTYNTYLARVLADPANAAALGRFQIIVASDKDFIATRVASKLNLRGPAVAVQTACSTSLVAVHFACQALLAGECQMALAGGSSIVFPQEGGYLYQPDGIFSPDGRCRAFDANAQGTVGGRGVGVVVLKPLQAAIADGDEVYAVIKGSALNNDGAFKVGFTAPAMEGQTRVLRAAYAVARVDPDTVTYIETHGTGTALGDPVEIAALTAAFRASTDRTQFCAIGSLKSNIGHLDAAAGIAGLIKTALALHHAEIPPTLHVERPNPAIGFEQTPFRVATRLSPWPANGTPRRAGVSGFGVGGTNAHVVLEEAPEAEPSGPSRSAQIIVLSAKSATALEKKTDDLSAYLRAHPEQPLADVALTCQQGRQRFSYRRALVCRDAADAATALATRDPRRLLTQHRPLGDRPVAFLFPGQGAQHANMALELYTHEPTFRAWIDRCALALVPHLGADLRDVLYPAPDRVDEANRQLEQTAWAQPALFVVELALAQLWMEWGVRPEVMIGHSIGEYVAACLAGVWSVEAALALVAARGRLMQALPSGAMLAVSLPEDALRPMLGAGVSIAAVNGPAIAVASGTMSAIAELEARLVQAGVSHQRLHTSHAFHSAAMDPILEAFAAEVRRVTLHAPSIPFVSNVTGQWIAASDATDPAYWVSHLRQTVRFGDGLATLLDDPARVALEVGPGNVLSRLVRAHPGCHADQTACESLSGARDTASDLDMLLGALGRLWLAGVTIDWRGFSRHERRRRVRLPTYPFERRRFWVGAAATPAAGAVDGRRAESELAADAAAPATPEGVSVRHPRPDLLVAYVAPRTDLETRLAALWEDLLGVAPIGAHDHFFELGGHSLLATQLTEALRKHFHVDLPTRAVSEAPTVEQLAAAITSSAVASAAPSDADGTWPTIVADPVNRHRPFALTDVQQAYWIGRSGAFELGQVATHSYLELQCRGLDLPRLTAAWRRMIARHDMLRAVVLADGLQQVLEHVPPYEIAVQDLRHRPAEAVEAALAAVRQQMSHQVLPADCWPLFDLRASRLDGDVVRLHFSFDLLIGDGWSWHILWRELVQFYEDPELQLPPLQLSFRDCVLAEIARQDSPAYRTALAYWLERLPTLPPAPELPLRASLARLEKPRFERRSARLSATRWRELKARATAIGLTPSGVLLAAFAEVLAAWSRPSRFTLNLTLFNRPPVDRDINLIIGDFTSLTLLAVDAESGDTFDARARRVQAQLFDDLDRRQVGGVRVLRELARRQGGGARPLMPVVFTSGLGMGDESDAREEIPFLALGEGVYNISQTPQVLIDHQVGQRGGALLFNWDVVEDALAPGVLDAMFDAYCWLLERLADERVWRAERLELTPPTDLDVRAQVNATATAVSPDHLHTAFARHARAFPERLAVIWPQGTMTYGELDRRANQLARRLRRMGAGPERLIGVRLKKGWEQVVAVIAILRAGAAYLPVGSTLPLERQRFLLECGDAAIVVTHDAGDDIAADGRQIIPLDAALWADEDAAAIDEAPGTDRLAYVIFTSGSTGVPKGVMIEHGAALNTVLDVNRRFDVGPSDRVLALSSLSFDLSVYDIFGTLAAGAAIVLPSADADRDPEHWMTLAADAGVTIWNSVPALMQMAVDALEGRGESLPRTLRLAMLSGDWLPVPLPDRIRRRNPRVEVVSLGGATEAAIWSICHRIGAVDPSWPSIPYGRPMANQTFHVLDRRMEPCPTWVPGELYIGGLGLARGYWKDEERTRASFVTHPTTGERLYRTGDLGRYWPDGDIEFLGREDFQVKVHGHRIELGEIEVALGQHPLVKAAAVAAIGEARGEKRLVAYIVAVDAAGDGVEDVLTSALRSRLPSYMVPDTFVMLDALPLTTNGKVDRGALPHPSTTGRAAVESVTPRDDLERRLATMWAAVLGVESVGVTDSFFALGGHSLSAVRLIARIERQLGCRIPLGVFFRQPTIESMAALVRSHDVTAGESVLMPLQPDGDRLPIFWVHGAGGHVFGYAALARALGSDQPFFAFQSRADADGDGLVRIEAMAADYCRELRRVQPDGPYQIGGWSMGGIVAFEMARQLIAAGAEVRHLAVVDAWAPELEAAATSAMPSLLAFARELGLPPDGPFDAIRDAALDPQTSPASLFQRMKDLGLLREDEDLDSVARLFDVFDRNLRALASYKGGPYPGRIALFEAADSHGVQLGDASAGWRALARGGVERHVVVGDHQTMLGAAHVTRLAALLRDSLDAADPIGRQVAPSAAAGVGE